MVISPSVKKALEKKIPFQTMHSRKKAIRKKVNNAISSEVALDIVASNIGIDVHKLLKKDKRLQELSDFKQAVSTFDFNEKFPKPPPKKSGSAKKEAKNPYDIPLNQYGIDSELVQDCKLVKPFRNSVKEALLTLETKIQASLGLDSSYYGTKLILEAKRQKLFDRKDKGESDGLFFLYMGAIQWLRNPAGHKKMPYSKEDAFKIVLFTDHLINLFDDIKHQRI